jgi:hemoglobin-like flavoprotein
MTPDQVALVRSSFAQVVPIGEQAAALFYERLFELSPHARTLFRGDMTEQGRKLVAMLGTVVSLLDQPDVLVPAAQRLSERHVGYGVQATHYPLVGEALLGTLQTGLGDAFTADTRAAWTDAYVTLAGVMLAAAAAAPPPAAAEA